jgi:hypothetical protein
MKTQINHELQEREDSNPRPLRSIPLHIFQMEWNSAALFSPKLSFLRLHFQPLFLSDSGGKQCLDNTYSTSLIEFFHDYKGKFAFDSFKKNSFVVFD